MRKLVPVIVLTLTSIPMAASACTSGINSSFNVSCQSGVSVYRNTPLAAPKFDPSAVSRRDDAATRARIRVQNAQLAEQSDRIDELEDRLEEATQPAGRSRRSSRSARVPVGAFGRGVGSGFGGIVNFGGGPATGTVSFNSSRLGFASTVSR